MITLTVKDIDVISTIDQLSGISFGPFLRESGKYVQQKIQERMSRGVDPDEQPYAPNTGRYATWKSQYYPGNPPLTLMGQMRKSLTEYLAEDETFITVAGMHTRIPHWPLFWGETAGQEPMTEIAYRHEFGGDVEPRPFLGINDADVEYVFGLFCNLFSELRP